MNIKGSAIENEVNSSLDFISGAVFDAVDDSMTGGLIASIDLDRSKLAKALIARLQNQLSEAEKAKMPTQLHEMFIDRLRGFTGGN